MSTRADQLAILLNQGFDIPAGSGTSPAVQSADNDSSADERARNLENDQPAIGQPLASDAQEPPVPTEHVKISAELEYGEVTIDVAPEQLLGVCRQLHDRPDLRFTQLIDLCGIDYSAYGQAEWDTQTRGGGSFSRGVDSGSIGRLSFGQSANLVESEDPRFAAVYHLLSIEHNVRLRVRCRAADDSLPVVPSVVSIWACADWYEREAFDLYGILFEGHPDLRRLLTDYGFVGHPFRKDFPLVGNVEMRFDPEKGRVVYEPVTIEPRVLVPRVIRQDSRYTRPEEEVQDSSESAN